ncbi:unnamed protein product [Mycena citricolor]|uniref:Uncharacterized protein n=1 Tax=Mycena citricolor TaxID=2018698 RepID=A0AAD2JVK6_9AGAR|nr:unnamed protein product [Mycena citricolor]
MHPWRYRVGMKNRHMEATDVAIGLWRCPLPAGCPTFSCLDLLCLADQLSNEPVVRLRILLQRFPSLQQMGEQRGRVCSLGPKRCQVAFKRRQRLNRERTCIERQQLGDFRVIDVWPGPELFRAPTRLWSARSRHRGACNRPVTRTRGRRHRPRSHLQQGHSVSIGLWR